MHGADELTTNQVAPPELMTQWQRRAVVTMFVILASLCNMTLLAHAAPLDTGRWLIGESFVAGSVFAQTSILAIWGGLGRQPLMVRMPAAIGTGALLGLALVWGFSRETYLGSSSLLPAILVVLLVTTQALALLLVRRYGRWQVGAASDHSRSDHSRFGSRSLLLWTTAIAVLLAIGRWAAPEHDVNFESLAETLIILLIAVPVATALSLPMVIASVRLVLGYRTYSHSAFWFSVASLVPLVAACTMLWTVGSPDPLVDALELVPIQAVLIVTLLSGMGLVRMCGFRLQRGADQATQVIASPEPAPTLSTTPQADPWRLGMPWRFRALAGTLSILIIASSLAAWKLEQRWQIRAQWAKLNLTIFFDGDRITSAHLTDTDPSRMQAAMEKLAEPQHASSIRALYFSGATLTDEQLQSLANLKHLETLRLNDAKITAAGMAHLQAMDKLAVLDLGGTGIGDDTLERFSTLHSLSYLTLDGTQVTEAGLAHLKALPKLKHVSLRNTSVSADAAIEFHESLSER